MHFQTVFGLDALEKISSKEYKRWQKYFEVFGPIHWKRADWNFAHIADQIVGTKETSAKDRLLRFRKTEDKPSFGGLERLLPKDELEEIKESAEIYE